MQQGTKYHVTRRNTQKQTPQQTRGSVWLSHPPATYLQGLIISLNVANNAASKQGARE